MKSSRKISNSGPSGFRSAYILGFEKLVRFLFAFGKVAVGEKSPVKLGESRRKLGEKIPGESSAKICEKTQRKLDQSSAKSRRKFSLRENSHVTRRKGGEANGFSSSGGESEKVRLDSPPFRSRRKSGGEFTSLIKRSFFQSMQHFLIILDV